MVSSELLDCVSHAACEVILGDERKTLKKKKLNHYVSILMHMQASKQTKT